MVIIFLGLSLETVVAAILEKAYRISYFLYFDIFGTTSIMSDMIYMKTYYNFGFI